MAIQQFQPINYAGMQQAESPTAGFMRGLQLVQGFQAMQQQAEERKLQIAKMEQDRLAAQAEAEQRKQYAADVAAAAANPTADAFAGIALKYPKQLEAVKSGWGMLEKGQRDAEFLAGAQAFNALGNSNPQAAKAILEERATAARNSGKDPSKIEAMIAALDTDPTKAQAHLGLVLSAVEPDQWKKMADEKRATEQAPADLKAKNAAAVIKQIEADFAPQKYQLDIDKQRADLAKTLADTDKSDADRRKTLAEIAALDADRKEIAAGKIPVKDRPKAEDDLRNEYLKNAGPMIRTRDAFRKIQAASPNAIGDLALVIGFNKVLDEGSVVKETEAEIVRNARALADKFKVVFSRIKDGDQLTDEQRVLLKAEAAKLMQAMERNEKEIRSGLTRIGKKRGLDTDNLFYDPSGELANAAENEGGSRNAVDIAGNPIKIPSIANIVKGDK